MFPNTDFGSAFFFNDDPDLAWIKSIDSMTLVQIRIADSWGLAEEEIDPPEQEPFEIIRSVANRITIVSRARLGVSLSSFFLSGQCKNVGRNRHARPLIA